MVDRLIGMNSGGKRAAPAAAHPVLDVETKDFVAQVLDGSMAVPVIVDFWAPWCGPCKTLGPIIEKVVAETRGQVRLVKVDIDKNPELAGQMRIQSIPAVYGFFGGRPVDGFVGALPESQVRSFVQRLLATVKAAGGGASNPLEQAMEQAMELQTAGDFEGGTCALRGDFAARSATCRSLDRKRQNPCRPWSDCRGQGLFGQVADWGGYCSRPDPASRSHAGGLPGSLDGAQDQH